MNKITSLSENKCPCGCGIIWLKKEDIKQALKAFKEDYIEWEPKYKSWINYSLKKHFGSLAK